jgi:uncharacterized protein YjeT (DUF2065 family)
MAPTYRQRLRREGAVLAATGAAGSAALLAATEEAARWPLNTAGQLVVVGGLLGWLGPRSARRAIEGAQPVRQGMEGSGEPTPLWQLPLIVAGLSAAVALPRYVDLPGSGLAGYDAALRLTGGCLLVGLAQAVLLERVVARDEARRGRCYVRIPGSRLVRGTRLGFTER